jgi:sulfite exporter TauE/SafE
VTGVFPLVVLGLLLGMRHATDPDHVIAVTTIVARQKTPFGATAIGAAWGVGHTLTILVVGGGIILFGWVIPPRLGLSMEFSVGLMLIALGLANLTGVMRRIREAHAHAREQTPLSWLDGNLGRLRSYQLVRPLVVGVVHGLAGSAAVALLVLTTIRNPAWALWYLLIFGIGTIVGMMMLTAVIVIPFTRTGRRYARLNNGLRIASGVISLGFGLFVAYRIGFIDGLFTGSPQWTPR